MKALALALVAALVGCGAMTAQDTLQVSQYEGQQEACVAANPHDKAAIDACRAAVRANWCAAWAKRLDAAVCPPAADGGTK